jgi:hypothetical protein
MAESIPYNPLIFKQKMSRRAAGSVAGGASGWKERFYGMHVAK